MEMWAVATLSLVAGLVDDLRSRKVHNALLLSLFPIVLAANLYFRGMDGALIGIGAFLLALILTLPLFAARIFGGGDVKLFAVFALCVDPSTMFYTLVFSLVWGAVFGLTRAALQRQILSLVRATYRAARRQRTPRHESIHPIPYTFALLLGWFTQLTLLRAGGLL